MVVGRNAKRSKASIQNRWGKRRVVLALSLAAGASSVVEQAAWATGTNGTWLNTGATNANWTTASNWVSNVVPGNSTTAISGSNADTSIGTFNTAVGEFGAAPIVIDSNEENIAGINFGTAAGNFVIGSVASANPLYLSSAGTIQILSTLTSSNAIETVNAPLVIESANGTYSLTNNSANGTGTGAGVLKIGGGITGGFTGSSNAVLTLSGSNTNANTVSGIIATGLGTTMAVTKSGAGLWVLTGANTYTGSTTINGGTLDLGGSTANGSISSSSALTLSGGAFTFTTTGTNAQTFNGTTINVGQNYITTNNSSDTINLGALTHGAGGIVDFGTAGTISASAPDGAILTSGGAAFATIGGDWAAENSAGTAIVGLSSVTGGYTATTANTLAGNADVASGVDTTLASSQTITSLRFNQNQARTITATGYTLITGGILVTSAVAGNTSTITGGTLEGANTKDLVVIQNGTGNLAISSAIANNTAATALTKSGAGTLTLSGADTYTGATYILAGNLNLQNNSALGTSSGSQTSAVTVYNGAALQLANNISTSTAIGLTINGSGQSGNGALESVSGTNTYSGLINPGSATTIGVDAGSTLTLSSTNVTGANAAAVITLGGAGTGFDGLAINTASGLVISGGGSWTMTNNNNPGAVSVNGGSTLNLPGGIVKYVVSVNSGSTFNETSAGTLSGTAAVSVNTGGTATLLGTNTNTGASSVNAGGTLTVGNATALGTSASTFNFNGGRLIANANVTLPSGNITLGSSATGLATVAGSHSIEFSGTLAQSATAGMFLSNILSSGAVLTFDNVTMETTASKNSSLTLMGSGSTVFAGAILNGVGSSNEPVTIASTGVTTFDGANTYGGNTTLNAGTLDLGGGLSSGSINTSTALVLGGGFLKYTTTGAPTQTFTGVTFNAGASGVNAPNTGTIALGAITARNVGSTVDFGTGGTTTTTSTMNTAGILGGYATIGGSDWAVAPGTSGQAFTAYASYTPSLAGTTAPGTTTNVDFQASNSTPWTNQTINSLRFATATANTLTLAASNTGTITSGGILVTSNVGNHLSTITGGTLKGASGKDLIVIQNNTSNGLTIGSVIADNTSATALTKSGPGLLTLTNANTYTGITYVNSGNLNLTGSLTSQVSVGSSTTASFNGTGSTTGVIGVANGGTVHPDVPGSNTLGHLSTGAATFADGSILSIDVDSDSTPGASYLNVAGAVALGSTNLPLLSVTDISSTVGGTRLGIGVTDTLPIITATGAITGTFAGLANGATVAVANGGNNVYTISYTTNAVDLIVAAAPEPGSLSLLGVASLGLLRRRRRSAK